VRREQILDAAEVTMLRNGMHNTTISEVAEAAGLGKGTIYLQFQSKNDLAGGLRQRYVERIAEEVRLAVNQHTTADEKLRAFVRTFITASIRRTDLHHLLFQDAGVDESDAFAPLRELFTEVAGAFPTANALAIDFALGGIHAAMTTVAHVSPARRNRTITQIADLVSRTLSG
jgi:AcrR family transcriptional regulator